MEAELLVVPLFMSNKVTLVEYAVVFYRMSFVNKAQMMGKVENQSN